VAYLFFYRKGKLYLVFEFMDKNLLEVIEDKPDGLDRVEVRFFIY
jgi:cyclin-dependent kinase-like